MPYEDRGIRINNFHSYGFYEVRACSGTGKGYCDFIFTNESGAFLRVITQEHPVKGFNPSIDNKDNAIVVSYSIDDEMYR